MGFVNEILASNLSYIRKYDEVLCKKIESIEAVSPSIELTYTDLGEPNLSINAVPISAQTGAQKEAETKVGAFSHNNPSSIHIVFGTGFGYIFKQAVEFSKGTVILYEPNLELLRVMLEMVDLTDVLARPRVYVANDLVALEKHFSSSFLPSGKTALTFTNYHRTCLKNDLDLLLKKLGVLQGIMETNENQRLKTGFAYAKDVTRNLPFLYKCNSINVIKDSLKSMPAIIAAAGPSLGENLELIKKYRDKFVLFAVSTSFASLVKNDISPDFVSMIERFDASNFVKEYSIQDVCLIAEPYVNRSVLNSDFKNKFITASVENSANKIYEKACAVENNGFETKGTVAYNALFAAKFLGCNPIILVGQDLAYVDGECYSKNSPLSDIKCRKTNSAWEIYVQNRERLKNNLYGHIKNGNDAAFETEIDRKVQELNAQLTSLKTPLGKEVATSLVFALFVEYYKSFANRFASKIDLYNVSQKGADIGDFRYKPLESILCDLPDIDKSKLKSISEISSKCFVDCKFLDNELSLLEQASCEIQSFYEDFCLLGEELKETSSNKEFALNLLKKILQQYMQIQQKFSKESVIYKEITMASKSAISNVMGDFSADILPVYSALGVFFNDDAGRIRYLIGVLKIVKKEIEDEIGCAKS